MRFDPTNSPECAAQVGDRVEPWLASAPPGEVVEVVTDPELKPLVVRSADGSVRYYSREQVRHSAY